MRLSLPSQILSSTPLHKHHAQYDDGNSQPAAVRNRLSKQKSAEYPDNYVVQCRERKDVTDFPLGHRAHPQHRTDGIDCQPAGDRWLQQTVQYASHETVRYGRSLQRVKTVL